MTVFWSALIWCAVCAAGLCGYVVGRAFAREEHISLQLENISLRGFLDQERIRCRTLQREKNLPPVSPRNPADQATTAA